MNLRKILLGWLPRRSQPLVESGIYGLAAGLSAVAFEVAIYQVYSATLVRFAHWGAWNFAWASFCIIVGTSLVSGVLLSHFAPEAAGSGILRERNPRCSGWKRCWKKRRRKNRR